MRISIAMCTYNGARYLSEQLESIAGQTYLPYELVVCDDGSTDATLQMVEAFADTVPFDVRIFRNPVNLGYTKNFEQAISFCEGDLIALSDQDDVWSPDKLMVMSSIFIKDSNVGGIFSDGDIIDSKSLSTGGSLWRSFRFDLREQQGFKDGKALEVLLRHNVITGMALVFRSKLREKLLPIPASWEHDGWLAIMIVLTSNLQFTTKRLVKYRVHGNQEIGVPEALAHRMGRVLNHGPGAFLRRSKALTMEDYRKSAKKFDDLARLLIEDERELSSRPISGILGKAEHCHAAFCALSTSRRKRMRHVLSRVRSYRLYSDFWRKRILKDLIL